MIKKTIWIFLLSCFVFANLYAEDKFVSLKKDKVNVRYGPSMDSPIKYIYRKKNLPIKQIDKKENWKRIIDLKNNSGWIHSRMLKSANSIIILENKILFKKPSNFSKPIVRLEKGRLLIIKKCQNGWCQVKTNSYSGWIKTDNIWGSVN
jgi:SH3-like domain-containing protein